MGISSNAPPKPVVRTSPLPKMLKPHSVGARSVKPMLAAHAKWKKLWLAGWFDRMSRRLLSWDARLRASRMRVFCTSLLRPGPSPDGAKPPRPQVDVEFPLLPARMATKLPSVLGIKPAISAAG